MQLLLYNLFLFLYRTSIRIASLFDSKARLWVEGRRDLLQTIKTSLPHDEKRIWIHCASLGEFEQGRPLIEALKRDYPGYKILLTFFSPSGYTLRKNYDLADYVFYLPMDGRLRSSRFVKIVNPSLAIFVKYEFWYYYICNLERNGVPTVLISGAFRGGQPFFKWYGGLFRKMLRKISFFFVQDIASAELLRSIDISDNVVVAGDTRYDRVYEIAQLAQSFPLIEQWQADAKLLIAGSTWPGDERVLFEVLSQMPANWKVILAPHEIDQGHIEEIRHLFGGQVVLYSQLTEKMDARGKEVLIIDNIGMLSSIFKYGSIAYIGGGFQKGGIHNTLEPAVFGLPVLFGPVYEKFVEARQLVDNGFAYPVQNAAECATILRDLASDERRLHNMHRDIQAYTQQHVGATGKIVAVLSGKYLHQASHGIL